MPLALKAGTPQLTIDGLRDGSRPVDMSTEEALVYELTCELVFNRGTCDETYRTRVVEAFGERGVIDLVGIIGSSPGFR